MQFSISKLAHPTVRGHGSATKHTEVEAVSFLL